MLQIETKRLILRSFTDKDAEAACHNSKQPTVALWMSDMVLDTVEDARKWIAWLETKRDAEVPFEVLAVERKVDGAILGLVGVAPKREIGNEIEILFAIADEHQHTGYATEAGKAMIWWTFEKAGQDLLSAIVKPENAASRRVIEKLGFIYCNTRTLPYDGKACAFDYFRLYHIDQIPGPEWGTESPHPPERMETFFDVRAEGYNAHMLKDGSKASYGRLGNCIPQIAEPLAILDLGCGTGIELEYIWKQAPNAQITCVDVSRGMLNILKRNYSDRHQQLTVVEASYLSWQYPSGAFDIVVSCNTMHHLLPDEKTAVYRQIRRAIKPGGCYLEDDFMVDAAMAEQYRRRYHTIAAHIGNQTDAGAYHVDVPLTIDVQKELLLNAGFQSVEVLYQCIRPRGSGAILHAKS